MSLRSEFVRYPGLADRSRAPHHSPARTSDSVIGLLRMAHVEHNRWGARKIKRWLEDAGHVLPAFSTVHNLMGRHGLLPGLPPGSTTRLFSRRNTTRACRSGRWM